MVATSASDSTTPKTVTASCPAGKSAVGGGAAITGADENLALSRTEPSVDGSGVPNGWIAEARETDSFGGSWSVSAIAICATVT